MGGWAAGGPPGAWRTWRGRGKSGTLHRLDIEPGDRTRTAVPETDGVKDGDGCRCRGRSLPRRPARRAAPASRHGRAPRPKDETSNELTLITNITDEAY